MILLLLTPTAGIIGMCQHTWFFVEQLLNQVLLLYVEVDYQLSAIPIQ